MRRKTLAIGLTVLALAVGGTAIATAAGGGGPFGIGGDPKEQEAELAKDLASKLDGVNAGQVQRALGEVREERHAERRKAEAEALAAELDGVSAAKIEAALEKLHGQMERSFRSGQRPRRVDFAAALAKEIDKPVAEVRKAMRAAHQKRFEAKLDEAVKEGRITEAQADRIRERMKNAPRGFRRFRGGPGGPGGPGHGGPGGPGGPGGGFGIPVPPPQ